MAVRIGC